MKMSLKKTVLLLALMLFVRTVALPSLASLNDTPRMTLLEQNSFDKWAEIPAQFHFPERVGELLPQAPGQSQLVFLLR